MDNNVRSYHSEYSTIREMAGVRVDISIIELEKKANIKRQIYSYE